jgi:tetratricopeptide (TPR) repeat protein
MSVRVVLQRGLLAVMVLTAAAGAAGEAQAQTAEQKRKAKEHFEKARRLYDVGKYKDAIEEYQKAYLNIEDPVFLYNIAQSYRLDNQPQEAVRFYKNYLRRHPDAENRAEVERKIEELQKAGDTTTPLPPDTTTPPPPDTTVPPPNVIAPPPANTLPPPVTTYPPPVTTPPPMNGTGSDVTLGGSATPPAEDNTSTKRTLGIALIVGGGLSVAVSAVTGVLANGKAKDQEKRSTFDPDLESSGKALSAISVVTGLTGLAAGVIGTIFLLKSRPSAGPSDVATGGSQLAIYPVAGPSFAGAGARLRF